MLDIHKILYPTDFSDSAAAAFPQAVQLAEMHDAELHVLHALVLYSAQMTQVESHYQELSEEAERQLAVLGEKEGAKRLRLIQAVRRGISPAPVILDYADEEDVDLIVIGSHGHGGLRRMLLGSVAAEVLRLAPCPVLTMRQRDPDAPAAESVERIVVPVDFSRYSDLAISYGAELAVSFGARLHLLHVIEQVAYPDFYLPVMFPESSIPELKRKATGELELLAERLRKARGEELQIGVDVKVGRTTHEIVDYARELGADLIVMASHGLKGLERVLLGSVTEGVMAHAPCSLLTVKAFGKQLVGRISSLERG